ncbi:hypothetical protein N5U20_08120 [Aliarcobacter butzleri]|uniref:hypothetical protein n=1 Tax=Aliarcobacter butzleri TaxID=28197 RepID=UPI0021B2EC71|nr:hypothetical protein [Aliarcobacter butzleri]MCT7613176.1 hypothetical protein [Aliarcobacter butzleri]MCT7640303.1 hypothetical protein [Aliarcobacter butzleri]
MIFKTVPEIEYLLQEIDNLIRNNASNIEFEKIYKDYVIKYPILKNYTLIVGTNDTSNNYFHRTIPTFLNEKTFFDYNINKKVNVNHYWFEFSNIIYLSNKVVDGLPTFDSTVFVDSNAMNIIDNFRQSPQDYKNSFLDFKIKYDIDLNYLPYLLEDYINPEHESFNLNKTKSKIESFEIVNNLDKEFYYKTGQIRIDQKKLEAEGYKTFEAFINDKLFYFANNFFERKDCKFISLPKSTVLVTSDKNDLKFNDFFSMYNLIYGYVLNILIEKYKNNSIESKLNNILRNMYLNGQKLSQILFFSYILFTKENEYKLNKFFNIDIALSSYEEILKKTRNITWDIFLYTMSQDFIVQPLRKNNNIEYRADFGIPLFLTMDEKFYNAFIRFCPIQIIIVDESTKERPYLSINTKTYEHNEFINILKDFDDKNKDISKLKERIFKKYIKNNIIYSIRRQFREKMERELKYLLKDKFNK